MSDPKHPTNPTWELYDPEVHPPPRGKSLLLLNEGGVLIRGTWYTGALAWGFAPRIPESVKRRLNQTEQAQPEPADPHATLRAEYAKQVREGTTGFYLWEWQYQGGVWQKGNEGVGFTSYEDYKYRYTDISCYVRKDGEPAIRMLRTEAQELQRKTEDTHDWRDPNQNEPYEGVIFSFNANEGTYTYRPKGTYAYRTKATIKLDGNMVTPEQAAAEWEAKKETHEVLFCAYGSIPIPIRNVMWFKHVDGQIEYFFRPKHQTWTGSRDDVIALLKEKGLL